MFNFKRLDILWSWIGHPSKRLWPFEFLESFRCSFSRVSIYHGPDTYTRVKSYGCLNLLRACVFNFQRLDILCAWIGDSSKMLWPFEFLKSLRCSFSSVLLYHGPHTYIRVKSYGRLNFLRAFVYNFESLDKLWAGTRDPSENLWPFEFLESFNGSFMRVSSYHGPDIYTRLKTYDCLNLRRAFVLSLKRLDILCVWIGDLSEMLWHLNFSRASVIHFRASRYIMSLTHTNESKFMAVSILWELKCSISSVTI